MKLSLSLCPAFYDTHISIYLLLTRSEKRHCQGEQQEHWQEPSYLKFFFSDLKHQVSDFLPDFWVRQVINLSLASRLLCDGGLLLHNTLLLLGSGLLLFLNTCLYTRHIHLPGFVGNRS